MSFLLFWLWGTTNALRQKLSAGITPDWLSILFAALGLVGIGFTLFLVIWPFLERNRAPHTFYALTNRRALIVVEGLTNRVQSVKPNEFSLERRSKPNGNGDIILTHETKGMHSKNRSNQEVGFFGIENARSRAYRAKSSEPSSFQLKIVSFHSRASESCRLLQIRVLASAFVADNETYYNRDDSAQGHEERTEEEEFHEKRRIISNFGVFGCIRSDNICHCCDV